MCKNKITKFWGFPARHFCDIILVTKGERMETLICKQCNNPLPPRRQHRTFCSHACFNAYMAKTQREQRQQTFEESLLYEWASEHLIYSPGAWCYREEVYSAYVQSISDTISRTQFGLKLSYYMKQCHPDYQSNRPSHKGKFIYPHFELIV